MKRLIYLFGAMLIVPAMLVSCSSDDDETPQPEVTAPVPEITGINAAYETPTFRVLEITPEVKGSEAASYKWTCDGAVYSTSGTLEFIAAEAGVRKFQLEVTDAAGQTDTENFTITVTEPATPYSNIQARLIEYDPAPAMEIASYTTEYREKQAFIDYFNKSMLDGKTINELFYYFQTGAPGGSAVFGFDHTVLNVPGENDLRCKGDGGFGVIYVAYDKNKNGVPDADEWYEIKESLYGTEYEYDNYSVTYESPVLDAYTSYRYKDNIGNESTLRLSDGSAAGLDAAYNPIAGWRPFPLTFTFKNVIYDYNITGYLQPVFGGPDADLNSYFDIDKAVDADGNFVHLPGVDFIKVQSCGFAGTAQMSLDFEDIYDLHITE